MLRLNLIPTAAANNGINIPQVNFLLSIGINSNISKDSLNIFIKNIEIKKGNQEIINKEIKIYNVFPFETSE
jgi:hypothetical protein